MKRILIFICCVGLLTGCGDEEMDVVKLDYISEHWNVKEMNSGRMDAKSETWASDLLDACTGELIEEIEEEVTIFNSFELHRKAIDVPHSSKFVMYLKGKENYTVCYDNTSDQMRAGKIDAFPSFVNTEKGVDIVKSPTIRIGTEEELKSLEQKDHGHFFDKPIRLLEETMLHVTPALHGKIDFTIGDRQGLFPLNHLDPYNAQMGEVAIALGYDEKSREAYFFYERTDGSTSVLPLVVWREGYGHEPIQLEDLQVERVLSADTLEPGIETPLYKFSFIQNGKRVNEDVRLTYMRGQFASKDSIQEVIESNSPALSGPFVFVHKKSLNGATDFQYPFVLRAEEDDISDLMNAIDDATPVKRAGDVTDYSRLTIVDGWGGQEFQLSFKERSQKIDVYLTDPLRDQTFKLSSKGAERFLDLFPEVKES